jgi:carboxypeptidase Taq
MTLPHATTTTDREALWADFKARLGVIADLEQAASLLSWDQQTYMPKGAAEARAQQLSTLAKLVHARVTDPEIRALLERLEGGDNPAGSDEAALLRVSRRGYDRASKLPSEFVEAFSRLRAQGHHIWAEARRESDFAHFKPTLEKLLEFALRQADYYGYDEHPFDALHDLYEPGSTAAKVKAVFEPLKGATVALLAEIGSGRELSDAPLRQPFDEADQEAFAITVVKAFGFDFHHGRLDRTVHPFAQSMSKYDVRITTRYQPDYLNSALFSILHEAGHGIYEQGIADAYQRLPLAEGASLGVHESQSRLYENLLGRSYPFWQHYYPRLQQRFPQLQATSLDDFYAAINVVKPSLIRVEADEVTYNLHIMVRFELELALLEGSLKVAELPEAWNAKYEAYLGITPPSDALGCLQDVHWSFGGFGYFPTYTLGNIMSVQLFEAAKRAHPEIERELGAGEFGTLLAWLRENVHRHGAKYEPGELLERATGSQLDAAPYIRYLQTKYRALYGSHRVA